MTYTPRKYARRNVRWHLYLRPEPKDRPAVRTYRAASYGYKFKIVPFPGANAWLARPL